MLFGLWCYRLNLPIKIQIMVEALTNLSTAQTMSQIQMRVARKILDIQQSDGQAVVKLIQAASDNVSKAGDALVAQATGLGTMLDVRA